MTEYRFVQVDVFTDRVFGGNPLAVFLDGRGLDDRRMQSIAREMNLSETTFVLPPTRGDCVARVRIFTPTREHPFAGHPTVGTAWVLARHGLVPAGTTRLSLEEGIGPVPVELERDLVWMSHQDATFGPELDDRATVARVLGLGESDLLAGAPIVTGSTGLKFLYVPLRDRDAVDRAAMNVSALVADVEAARDAGVFVFAPNGEARLYSRMFAQHRSGVPEDPATGSASGPLGAYVVRHGIVKPRGAQVRLVSEQGTTMGRQSFVHITLRVDGDRQTDIKIGGGVVPVFEGRLPLP